MMVSGAEFATWSAGRGAESVEFRGPTVQARFVLARQLARRGEICDRRC
jgi:hypothetical protein